MNFRISCLNNDCVQWPGGFWGEHGVSFLIETSANRILFDTGESGEILAHNLGKLKTSLKDISNIVLSHGHHDHSGGLMWVLEQTRRPIVIADPLLFSPKYNRHKDTGELTPIGIPFSITQVEAQARLHLTTEEIELTEGISVTGRIVRTNTLEQTPENMLVEINGALKRDFLEDDRSIVLHTQRGLVVLCGCCHAGLVNTLAHVKALYPEPIYAIIGGIHLVGADARRIEFTAEALRDEFQPEEMYFNHCSGTEATVVLTNQFGERVKPCLAGTVLEF